MLTQKELKTKQAQRPGIEVSRMWIVRTKIVPITTGALGTIKKGLDQNLNLLPGQQLAIETQKITLMSTTYIILKVLG